MHLPRYESVLIIGIGNEYRCDDAVGLIVARNLRKHGFQGLRILEASGEGAELAELWKAARTVILIDAVQSGARPGSIHYFAAHRQPIPAEFCRHSTHGFGVAEAIELERTINQLPRNLTFYGIEVENCRTGVGLSPEVKLAADVMTKRILTALRTDQRTLGGLSSG